MDDVQSHADVRAIPIDIVGVSDLRYPIVVLDRAKEKQTTVAALSLAVSLPHDQKGTHMSRFVEVLEGHRGEFTLQTMPVLLQDLRRRLAAEKARVKARFPYFVEKAAPVSGATGLMDYDAWFMGEASEAEMSLLLGVRVPVTSLCPCSKAISDYGAHNQRGYISIEVRSSTDDNGHPTIIWIEELIEVAEASASAPVYALLKRGDERHVTMQAYDNPVFVEDMVRNVAARLKQDGRVQWFRVHAVNHESIHNHGAFAKIEWRRPEGGARR